MEELIPIVAILSVFGLPMLVGLISIVLKHQRDMSKLIQGQNTAPEVSAEISALRAEIVELKETMMNHALSLDSNVRGLSHRMETMETQDQRQSLQQ